MRTPADFYMYLLMRGKHVYFQFFNCVIHNTCNSCLLPLDQSIKQKLFENVMSTSSLKNNKVLSIDLS